MSSGIRSFLFSAAIVGTGLFGIWAWPSIGDGGADALITRIVDDYRKTDTRLRTALAALGTPAESVAPPESAKAASASDTPMAAIKPQRMPAEPPVVPASCDARSSAPDAAVIGDRLQLRIFETSTLAGIPDSDQAAASATSIIFERLDLSGVYEVSATGTVSLPAMGHVDVVGRSLPCIESLVSRKAFERLNTENTVSAAFAARPPILVRGAVRMPGSHAYSASLTVERVLAQAGALEATDPESFIRFATLDARRRELERSRAGLDLEHMRLEAVLASADALTDDKHALRKAELLAGEGRVSSERAALAAKIAAQRLRQTRTDQHLRDLDTRIDMAKRQLESAQAQLAYLGDRRDEQAGLLESGKITEFRMDGTAIKAMEAEQVLLQKQEALLQLQAERRLAANDSSLDAAERQSSIIAELRTLAAQSDRLDSEYRTVLAELEVIGSQASRLAVTIDRPTGSGNSRNFVAVPSTRVRPGDLVTVSIDLDKMAKQARLGADERFFKVGSNY